MPCEEFAESTSVSNSFVGLPVLLAGLLLVDTYNPQPAGLPTFVYTLTVARSVPVTVWLLGTTLKTMLFTPNVQVPQFGTGCDGFDPGPTPGLTTMTKLALPTTSISVSFVHASAAVTFVVVPPDVSTLKVAGNLKTSLTLYGACALNVSVIESPGAT